jgi:hypothetical protein
MTKQILIFHLSILGFYSLSGQTPVDSIDFSRIPQKSVRILVIKEKVQTIDDFQCLNTSCYQPEDSTRYLRHLKTYRIQAPIDQVWSKYTSVSPMEAWNGRMVKFGFIFSRLQNRFIYPENARDPMSEGNIIYVNLRLLNGLKNLGVAFEVTSLDSVNKVIRFCYLKDGISKGTQEIRFTPTAEGNTLIIHETHYHSGSRFRDKELYPVFHEKLVGEFHNNLRQLIEGSTL